MSRRELEKIKKRERDRSGNPENPYTVDTTGNPGNPSVYNDEAPSNPLTSTYTINTVKTGGVSRKVMEFVTSERHAIGIYKRCVYEIEGMDSAVEKLKAMPEQSKLNHKKVQLLNSYTKHYNRFKKDLNMLLHFVNVEEKLKEEFASSHDVEGKREWKNNLEDWKTPGYPKTPATYQREYNIHP